MAYILSAQRSGPKCFQEYERYVLENEARFPSGAYALVTSGWYFDDGFRGPHDAWLEWAKFEEHATGARSEVRHLSLRLRLLSAYHDKYLEYFYPQVFAFRVSPNGNLLHEIEWAGAPEIKAHWLIEASDVEFTVFPREKI